MLDQTAEKKSIAIAAIKDVLYMYVILTEYSCIYDDFSGEKGKFDPAVFIDCVAEDYGIEEHEAKLLHEGSAIKLICSVYQEWSQGGLPYSKSKIVHTAEQLINSGRLGHIGELENVLKVSLESYVKAESMYPEIYEKYVVEYFSSLLRT